MIRLLPRGRCHLFSPKRAMNASKQDNAEKLICQQLNGVPLIFFSLHLPCFLGFCKDGLLAFLLSSEPKDCDV